MIILLFLSTGIRCSALFKLDMNSVNWDNSTLIVMDKVMDEINKKFGKEILKRASFVEKK